MSRPRTAAEQQAHDIFGKGWTISELTPTHKQHRYRYVAHIHIPGTSTKKNISPCCETQEEAARLAVGAAWYYGQQLGLKILDWKKSVEWCRCFGWELSYDDRLRFQPYRKEKGWYVLKRGGAYVGYTGPNAKTGPLTQVPDSVRVSKKISVMRSIEAAKSTPWYHEYSTTVWLRRNNMDDLVPTALTKKKGAA